MLVLLLTLKDLTLRSILSLGNYNQELIIYINKQIEPPISKLFEQFFYCKTPGCNIVTSPTLRVDCITQTQQEYTPGDQQITTDGWIQTVHL